jgi:hypothetical protein
LEREKNGRVVQFIGQKKGVLVGRLLKLRDYSWLSTKIDEYSFVDRVEGGTVGRPDPVLEFVEFVVPGWGQGAGFDFFLHFREGKSVFVLDQVAHLPRVPGQVLKYNTFRFESTWKGG